MGGGFYPSLECAKPPFDLPVIYEDDHFAIGKKNLETWSRISSPFIQQSASPPSWSSVNKPAGILVYAHRSGGHGRMTIRSALPYVLKPPRKGTVSILRRTSELKSNHVDTPLTMWYSSM